MSNKIVFKEATKKYLPILDQYIPLVARVHGGSHPEFHDINKLYDLIRMKSKESGPEIADLKEEFTKLREISNNYTTPGDVCESYEAVYQMLAVLDEKYHA